MYPFQKLSNDVKFILSGGITFQDNMNAAIIEFDAKHGVETLFLPPDKMKHPLTFIPISAKLPPDGTGADIQISSKSALNYSPTIGGVNRTDGRIGITIQYSPPLSYFQLDKATVTATANGAFATLQFPTISPLSPSAFQVGIGSDFLIENRTGVSVVAPTTRITALKTGVIQVNAYAQWDSALNGHRRHYLQRLNSAGASITEVCYKISPGGNFVYYGVTEMVAVNAGDFFETLLFQDSGGALNVNRSKVGMNYVSVDPSTVSRVRGILVGA